MKRIIPIILSFVLLCGCSSGNSQTQSTTETVPTENISTETAPVTDSSLNDQEVDNSSETAIRSETDSESMENVNSTELFESIYVPYANREKAYFFESVKTFVQTTEYEIEITEPTPDIVAQIKLTDNNGDYVYFAFHPIDDIEMLMVVNYYRDATTSEVSMSNYSTNGSPAYDAFSTHVIGEGENKVNGTDEQRLFLFK